MPTVTISWDAAATNNLQCVPLVRRSADTLPSEGAPVVIAPGESNTFLVDQYNGVAVTESDQIGVLPIDLSVGIPT